MSCVFCRDIPQCEFYRPAAIICFVIDRPLSCMKQATDPGPDPHSARQYLPEPVLHRAPQTDFNHSVVTGPRPLLTLTPPPADPAPCCPQPLQTPPPADPSPR
uniref:Uncharacterized protein n=1 Tax=Knipowitschia caucasica TaxID=637954 RepID=A0AAV2MMX2_KNICA